MSLSTWFCPDNIFFFPIGRVSGGRKQYYEIYSGASFLSRSVSTLSSIALDAISARYSVGCQKVVVYQQCLQWGSEQTVVYQSGQMLYGGGQV